LLVFTKSSSFHNNSFFNKSLKDSSIPSPERGGLGWGLIHTSKINGLSIYGFLSFPAGLVKISSFLALVVATKNNLLSS
jgi:hypothetical protein